jgi:hypothetical protein
MEALEITPVSNGFLVKARPPQGVNGLDFSTTTFVAESVESLVENIKKFYQKEVRIK